MDAYIGEIRIFAGNFAPRNWAFCDGQLLPVSQNAALFSLLGNAYGGDGRQSFALPDLRGRAPMHWGKGNGLTPRQLAEPVGESAVTLQGSQMPQHSHQARAVSSAAEVGQGPEGATWAQSSGGRAAPLLYGAGSELATMAASALSAAGGSQPHNNMQPYQTLNFIICLQGGEYPPRS